MSTIEPEFRVGRHQPGNLYRNNQRFGFVLRDEDGPMVAAALNAYAEERPGSPRLRVWHKGDQQPDEVYRVTDRLGGRWEFKLGGDWGRVNLVGGIQYPWGDLLKLHGPLTEVPEGGDSG